MSSALSSFNTTTEVLLSKTLNPQLLPGRRSINDCPLLRVCVHSVCVCSLLCVCSRCVCVHFGWVKCRAQIPRMGYHTWSYVTSLSLIHVNIYKLYTFFLWIYTHFHYTWKQTRAPSACSHCGSLSLLSLIVCVSGGSTAVAALVFLHSKLTLQRCCANYSCQSHKHSMLRPKRCLLQWSGCMLTPMRESLQLSHCTGVKRFYSKNKVIVASLLMFW